mmetsp:Transcript_20464/g.33686  ORF Transcript_20464/g.33686 Transcript_20464/m.33686 type:complete len:96 (+) Transcript_20464:744-1031(+)
MSTARSIIILTLVAGSNASIGANGATARAGSFFADIIATADAAVEADIICWSTYLRSDVGFDDKGAGAKANTTCVLKVNITMKIAAIIIATVTTG